MFKDQLIKAAEAEFTGTLELQSFLWGRPKRAENEHSSLPEGLPIPYLSIDDQAA